MSINFTGDVTFKNKLFTLMGLNEASGKTSNTPYVLSWANTANSGWSFGYIQYDLSTGNADGNDLFKDILRNAVDSAGNYIIDDGDPTTGRLDDKLVAALCNQAKTKNGQGLSSAEQSLISSALSSTYGMREINGNVDGALQKLIDFADKVKVAASPSDQAFLQSDLARLFLCDYGNEFGVNGTGWLNFVQGSSFNGYQKNGALGVDDLLGGYFRTAEAQKDQGGYLGANTVLKRFAAVVQVAGGYTPTDLDEAKGVLRAYTYLYVPHEDQILATNARVQNLNAFRDAVCKPAESLVFADLESRGISVTETYDDILVGDDTGNITASGEYQLNGRDGNDVILGEGGNDTLDGGAGQDTLIGGIGTDTLIGGAGDDTLYGNDNAGGDILDGGVGNDTYYADDGDTIRDSDGQGTIYLNGKQLSFATRKKGEILYKDAAGNTYLQIGNTLQINDPLVIENFTAGDLGITLDEYSPPSPGSNPLQEAFGKAEQTKSPIVLDLNGNGIATQDVSNGTFFDYDGNGFAERTGWATSGDGILVRDLNGNGKIDDGTELFGDRTQLKNGQTAANGFAALADLDSNGDSKLDSQDSAWAELNIWQDRNSDGIANAGELKTLSDLGIQSIATGYTTSISTDANGNTHQQQGSYTKTDGSTALAEDVWFKADQSSTRNLNLLAISEVIHNMPEIQGKGNVASLRQVLAQQAANGSSTLMNLIDQFAAEADPVARNALTTRIIYEWTGVTDKDPMSRAATKIYNNPIGDARKLYAMEALLGEGYVGTWCWGEQDPNPHGPASAVLLKAYDEFANGIAAQLIQQTRLKELYGAISYTWDATSQTLHGDLSSTLPLITAKLEANREQGKSALAEFITNLTYTNKISEFDTRAFQEALVAYGQDVVSVANLAWRGMIATQGNDQLTGDGSDEVIAGWGGNDLIYGGGGNDSLLGGEGNDALYGQDGNDTLDGGLGNDLLDGGAGNDTYLFGRTSGQDTILSQDNTANKRDVLKFDAGVLPTDIDLIRNIDDLILTIRDTGNRMTVAGYFVNDGVSQSSLQAIEFNDGTAWDFAAVKAMLPSLGTEGNDQIRGYNTAEVINGLVGNDVIEGRGGDDVISGGAGNDTLFGQEGNDTLDGGIGNDALQGGAGNDTYLFNQGGGQDTIHDIDSTAGNVDTVRFGAGIAVSDIAFSRSGNDLVLGINGTSDQLIIQSWGSGNAYRIERVEFADGSAWDAAYIQSRISALPIVGTNGNDYLNGWADSNDTLQSMGGNDTLIGSNGNDTLDGGTGNDTLRGYTGNDTYLFNLGGGQDIISEYDYTADNVDTIRFGAGIAASDIAFSRSGNDLALGINGTSDRLSIPSWGAGNAYRIERVEFADGTAWDTAYIQSRISALPIVGTNGNDSLNSWSGSIGDQLQGMEGNDTLIGSTGNDMLDGGTGNDNLYGGTGNDTYLFNLGGGRDTIYDNDSTAGNVDTIRFGVGIATGDINFSRSGNDLVLGINGTSDRLSIQSWGAGSAYRIERVEFADGAAWDTAYIQSRISALPIVGTNGNDYLNSWSGSIGDQLQGIEGNDTLIGSTGNDMLDGGTGNDTLQGGTGNDTYLFNLGGGRDTIYDNDSTAGNVDTIRFGAGIATGDISFSRSGNDLMLSINGTTDQLKVQNWGYGDAYRIEQVAFVDGTIWDSAYLQAQTAALLGQTILGTEGTDYLQSWVSENATLQGMGGNDTLIGNNGNDTLDGGSGNDILQGGAGNDTYLFNLGGGQDVISEYDSSAGNVDTIRFGVGIAASDISFARNGYDLVLGIGTTDQLKIQSWGYRDAYRIERVEFADGASWDAAYLQEQVSALPIVGTTGNDYLFGDSGNNTLDGGTGNDTLQGGAGNDTYLFNLGGGQDTIYETDSTAGNVDTIRFGAGIAAGDITFSYSGNDLVLAINGTNDQVKIQNWGYSDAYRIERVQFADGASWDAAYLQTQVSAIPIVGTTGNDSLYGDSWNNTLDGGAGNDTLHGGAGNDTYLFNLGDGQDTIYEADSTAGNVDTLRFGAGIAASNIIFTYSGNDLLLSIKGATDQVILQNWNYGDAYRIERVAFVDGTVWGAAYLQAQALGKLIVGTTGNDYLSGDIGNDTLDGGIGNDTLQGGAGNDTYLFNLGDGQDIIYDGDSTTGNVDTVRFDAGIAASDIAFSHSGNDLVLSINGTDDRLTIQHWGYGDYNHIERVEFADGMSWNAAYLQAQFTAAPIVGTTGNDYLSGDAGSNTLDGGAGNDYLYGGTGNDTYLFNLGGGQDTISDYDSTTGNVDTIRFGTGIVAGDITFNRSGNDLVLTINGTTDQLKIQNWGYRDYYQIERVEFADGTSWDAAYLQTNIPAPTVVGTAGDDTLSLWVNDSGTFFQGMEGNDVLIGNSGNDILDGGVGNDTLQGGAGNDTYLFNLGDGQDTIYDGDSTAGNMDTIRFGAGIAAGDIRFSGGYGGVLVLGINGTTDQLKIQSWGYGDYYHIEQVAFADGTSWNEAYLQEQFTAAPIVGTVGNDYLTGNSGNNTLDGGAGNDYLYGGTGNDTYLIHLGGGQDTISEYDYTAGNVDTIRFGIGIAASDVTFSRSGNNLVLSISGTTDQLTIKDWGNGDAYHIERIEFADGTVWGTADLPSQLSGLPLIGTSGNDYLYGDAGNDTLDGGAGNDTLVGGTGNDTYLFNLGGGQDRISEYDSTPGNVDTVRLGKGIMAEDITFSRNGYDLVLGIDGTSEQLTIQNWGYGDYYHIERVQFADGTSWDAAYLQAQDSAIPIVGTIDNDYLSGDAGNNTLDGGAGNDYLNGGRGNDTYLFNLGGGQDTIYDYDSTAGNMDTIRFGAGIAEGDITLTRSGNDLVLGINGTAEQLTIQKWRHGDAYHIERVQFADGTVWDAAFLSVTPISGTEEADSLQAWAGENATLQGLGGGDALYGNDGNDILDGGAGNDYLSGSTGNDTYLFNLGGGQDNIYDGDSTAGNVDTIRFGAGIAASDITFTRSGGDLLLSINGTADQLTIQNWRYGDAYHIERVGFADGTVWDAAFLSIIPISGTEEADSLQAWAGENATLQGLGGGDALYGNDGNDILDGGAGNDYLSGSTGNDTYLFNLGGGQDNIYDGDSTAGNVDTIRFGAGIAASDITFTRSGNALVLNINGTADQLTIQSWRYGDAYHIERVEFADGTVWDAAFLSVTPISGTEEADSLQAWAGENATLQGLGGNDVLYGNDGNDILDGGPGNDYLSGRLGNDVYLFGLSGGQDVISDRSDIADNVDTIRFGGGISAGDIIFTRSGMDLVLGINGTNDQLTLIDWGYDANCRIERVEFADGTVWDADQLQAFVLAVPISGTEEADELEAWVGENATLQGLGGDDSLYGDDGNDILDGGAGSDYLSGGLGNDVYVFGLGGGQDQIADWSDITGNVDTIRFGGGIAASDIIFTRSGMDLVLSINGTNDQLTLIDWGYDPNCRIERVEFADGTVWDADQLQAFVLAVPISGTEEADELEAWVGENATLQGLGGNDSLYGYGGNDILDGGVGNDYLSGSTGNDTYIVDSAGDVVVENADEGTDTVQSSISYTLDGNVENLTLTGAVAIDGTGNNLDNMLTGNSAINVLSGGLGNDTYIIDNVGDIVIENADEGTDTVQSSVSYTLGANAENLTLTGMAAINGTGNGLDNVLIGNSAMNTLTGGNGNDTLDGGLGADTLIGGLGNDTYIVDNAGDVVKETSALSTEIDMVLSSVTYTLGSHLENLTLTGTSTINGTGNSLNNTLLGNSEDNVLNGGAGADQLLGGLGNDIYVVDNIGDVITENLDEGIDTIQSSVTYTLSDNVENLILTGTAGRNGTGNALDNLLIGNNGNNVLDGGIGADTMMGGLGNDTYIVDNTGDVVTEDANEGTDTVQSSITYTLGGNVEKLILTGTDALDGTGNTLNNALTGNEAANILDGGTGADTMKGGAGNDTYVVDNSGDVVTEKVNEGNDTVQSSITYTLSINVENLTLTGTSAINGTGNSLNNTLLGNSEDNVLNGGAGADQLLGGLGNDIYVVDNIGDAITENPDEGIDTIRSSATYTLSDNVENLILTGTARHNGTGNALDNLLIGNSGNNVLDGGIGADTMMGGTGNDTYIVDNTGDVATENVNEGIDTVQSSITYTLGENVEKLILTGTDTLDGTGNTLNNTLTGNEADNVLDGGTGADTMIGGLGNDTYIVDNAGDVVKETSALGTEIDTVLSSVTYTLGSNVENLTLTGTSAINGTGNSLNNTLIGNSGNNVLTGGTGSDLLNGDLGDDTLKGNAGNDILQGGADNDTLSDTAGTNLLDGGSGTDTLSGNAANEMFVGGTGNDTISTGNGADIIAFNRGDGMDVVNGGVGTDNTLSLGGGIQYSDLALSKSGNDLILEVGNSDQITLSDWYNTTANHKSVLNLQVVADAMAGFDRASSNPLLNKSTQNYDFTAIVNAFDQASGGSANFMHWSATDSLLTSHLSASDSEALGGDLANQYGKNGNFSGFSQTAAQDVLSNPAFGTNPQLLHDLAGLSEGIARLS